MITVAEKHANTVQPATAVWIKSCRHRSWRQPVHVTDGMRSPWKHPVYVVSKEFTGGVHSREETREHSVVVCWDQSCRQRDCVSVRCVFPFFQRPSRTEWGPSSRRHRALRRGCWCASSWRERKHSFGLGASSPTLGACTRRKLFRDLVLTRVRIGFSTSCPAGVCSQPRYV